jgi:hypothetical protein
MNLKTADQMMIEYGRSSGSGERSLGGNPPRCAKHLIMLFNGTISVAVCNFVVPNQFASRPTRSAAPERSPVSAHQKDLWQDILATIIKPMLDNNPMVS